MGVGRGSSRGSAEGDRLTRGVGELRGVSSRMQLRVHSPVAAPSPITAQHTPAAWTQASGQTLPASRSHSPLPHGPGAHCCPRTLHPPLKYTMLGLTHLGYSLVAPPPHHRPEHRLEIKLPVGKGGDLEPTLETPVEVVQQGLKLLAAEGGCGGRGGGGVAKGRGGEGWVWG